MEKGGNKRVNAIFEAKWIDGTTKLNNKSSGAERQAFCRDKYNDLKYCDASIYENVADIMDAEPPPKPEPPLNGKAKSRRPRFDRQMSMPVLASPKFGEKPRLRDSDLSQSVNLFEDLSDLPIQSNSDDKFGFPSMQGMPNSQLDDKDANLAWDDIGGKRWDPFSSEEVDVFKRHHSKGSNDLSTATWHAPRISKFIESQSGSDGSLDFDEFSEVKWDEDDTFGKKKLDKLKQNRKSPSAVEQKPTLPVSHEEEEDSEPASQGVHEKRRLHQSETDFNMEDKDEDSNEDDSQPSKSGPIRSSSQHRKSRRSSSGTRRALLQKTMSVPALRVGKDPMEELEEILGSTSSTGASKHRSDKASRDPPGRSVSGPIKMVGRGSPGIPLDSKSEHSKGRRRMLRRDRQNSEESSAKSPSSLVSRRSRSSGRSSSTTRSGSRDSKRSTTPSRNRSSSKDSSKSTRRSRTPTASRRSTPNDGLSCQSEHRQRSSSNGSRSRRRPRSVEASAKASARRAMKRSGAAEEDVPHQETVVAEEEPDGTRDDDTSGSTDDEEHQLNPSTDDSSPSNSSDSCEVAEPEASFGEKDETGSSPAYFDKIENVLEALDVSA